MQRCDKHDIKPGCWSWRNVYPSNWRCPQCDDARLISSAGIAEQTVVRIYKASAIGHTESIDLLLTATGQVPELSSLNDQRLLFEEQARIISDAMFTSLPGGTIDALLVEMMRRKVSLLVVPL